MTTKIETKKPAVEKTTTDREVAVRAYQPPRITRKQSLERVTLASGSFGQGGIIGGD